jgi:hypothetical protein
VTVMLVISHQVLTWISHDDGRQKFPTAVNQDKSDASSDLKVIMRTEMACLLNRLMSVSLR